jgi:hypothetical protein
MRHYLASNKQDHFSGVVGCHKLCFGGGARDSRLELGLVGDSSAR